MDMSAAALPPRAAHYSRSDEQHPLFPAYREYLYFCARQMIGASDFRDWVYKTEQSAISDRWADHAEYPAFLDWIRATKAGARPCCPSKDLPLGLSFPRNFQHWLEGGRW